MKYSTIFPYRDREEHLKIIVPRIHERFSDMEYEIIVAEQNDTLPFRRGNLFNEGVKLSTGDILILSDVDYYPSDNVIYYDGISDAYLPVKRVIFTYNNLEEKPLNEVSKGYRHFRDSTDEDFWGGVSVFRREAFYRFNGFNPLYVGWGREEWDARARAISTGLTYAKSTDGLFYALDHIDSGTPDKAPNLSFNIHLSQNWQQFTQFGINNSYPADVTEVGVPEQFKHLNITKWVHCTNFDAPPPPSHIVVSSFLTDEL